MNTDKYVTLKADIEERLQTVSLRFNLDKDNVIYNYRSRLNNLCRAYPQEEKSHLSKLMVRAYEGTLRYYEEKVQ